MKYIRTQEPDLYKLPRFRVAALVFSQLSFTCASLLAQTSDGMGTLTFETGTTIVGTPGVPYDLSSVSPPTHTVIFQTSAILPKPLLVNLPNVSVSAGVGSAIQGTASNAYALKFSSTGGLLNAGGLTLTSSAGADGALSYTAAGTATLSNSTISTSSATANASAVYMQAGGSFSLAGGTLRFRPTADTATNLGYGFRAAGGTTTLSLENVTVTGGETNSHRSFGISVQGGGSVTLKGTTTTVTARQNPALDLNGEFIAISAAELKSLSSGGLTKGTSVRLQGGSTQFTQTADGKSYGSTTEAACLVESNASGSKITNAGLIEGLDSAVSTGTFEVVNSGQITSLGTTLSGISSYGGKFTNQAGGTISGTTGIVSFFGSSLPFEVTNAGNISGAATGIFSGSSESFSLTNQLGGTISGGTTTTAVYRGVDINNFTLGGTLENNGLITGNDGVVLDGGTPASTVPITLSNAGEITAVRNSAIQVFGRSGSTFTRDISITNSAAGLIRGGLVTPGFFSVANAAVYASNSGNGSITIDNYGTIDARSRGMAIAVATSDSSQALITLHSGSNTLGTIRSQTPFGINTSTTLAFSGSGSYTYDISGITRLRKANAGVWTYSGERGGSSVEVSAGELILARSTTASGVAVSVAGGKLTVSPTVADGPGVRSLWNNDLDVGVDGELVITSSARSTFGGNAGVQRVHNGGLLRIDGSADFSSDVNFACNVETQGRLAGDGSITGQIVFVSGGALEPGNGSAGDAGDFALVSTSSGSGLTFGNGGVYRWTLGAYSDANPGIDSDLILLNSLGTVVFQNGARIDLDFAALGGVPDPLESINPFWRTNHTWQLISGGTVTTPGNLLFSATNQSTYPIPSVGTFSLSADGRTLIWTAAPVTDPFTLWMNSFATITDPLMKLPAADADGDGVNNLAEFALDGNPSNPSSMGKTRVQIIDVSGNRYLSLTLPVRVGAVFSGPGDLVSAPVSQLIYRIQGSADLSDFVSAELSEVTPARSAGMPALSSSDWEYRTFRLNNTVSTQPKGFMRAAIQSVP